MLQVGGSGRGVVVCVVEMIILVASHQLWSFPLSIPSSMLLSLFLYLSCTGTGFP